MRYRGLLVVLLVWGAVAAQDGPAPLFLFDDGGVFATTAGVDAPPAEVLALPREVAANSRLAYAPDGAHAMLAVNRNLPLPNDPLERTVPDTTLMLWAAGTGELTTAVAAVGGGNAAHRYHIAWAPAGRKLAYVETQTTLADERQFTTLWAYNLDTRAARQVATLDVADIHEVVWYDTDILLVYNPTSGDSSGFDPGARGVRVIDPETGDSPYADVMPFVFDGDGQTSALAFFGARPLILRNETYFSRDHLLYDPFARAYYRVPGVIARTSRANADTALRVIGGTRDQLGTDTYWRVLDGGAEVVAFGENVNTRPELAPDGRAVVMPRRRRDGEDLPSLVYQNGAVTALPFAAGRPAWGATTLEIIPDAGDLDAGCALPGRVLTPYETATVLPGTPNNVRAQPDTAAAVTGRIAAGETFTPLASFCDGDIRWWFVEHGDAARGWTAERVGGDVFVGPAG